MADQVVSAITAIGNIERESQVAVLLAELGLKLLYRATGIEGLERAAADNPDAVIIRSPEFHIRQPGLSNQVIEISPQGEITQSILRELLRNLGEGSKRKVSAPPLSRARVITLGAINSGTGLSTLAINLADASSRQGKRTLLLDCNLSNPYLSHFFDLQRINRACTPTRFGFDIGEISDVSTLSEFAEAADRYDEVIIDTGRMNFFNDHLSGKRIDDLLALWALESANDLLILSRSNSHAIALLKEQITLIIQRNLALQIKVVVTTGSAISTREKRAITAKIGEAIGYQVTFLSRDVRSTEKGELTQAPLSIASPKSFLSGDIASLYRELRKKGE